MPSTNGHGPKRAVLYARVSTDEQARSGYSLAQQVEALRVYAASKGYEALNDRGDDSPEGQLTDGIIDQIARFERMKTAERTRRGKLQRAREGKIVPSRWVNVPSRWVNYGFRPNADRTNYLVDEERMRVVRRVVRMAADGMADHGIKRALDS
jgi:DNA invertase Pin-like site-specific DNA recombinase